MSSPYEPADSTRSFVSNASFASTEKGLQAAIEVIAYPAGHVQVVSSRISGPPGKRTIVQASAPLMFNNIEETKDAIDLVFDRLSNEAEARTALVQQRRRDDLLTDDDGSGALVRVGDLRAADRGVGMRATGRATRPTEIGRDRANDLGRDSR